MRPLDVNKYFNYMNCSHVKAFSLVTLMPLRTVFFKIYACDNDKYIFNSRKLISLRNRKMFNNETQSYISVSAGIWYTDDPWSEPWQVRAGFADSFVQNLQEWLPTVQPCSHFHRQNHFA
jgi:hypothetical protein